MPFKLPLLSIFGALLFTGCTYDAPLDPNVPPAASVITGSLIANGVEVPGDVIVLAYDANSPPPPAGTGKPVTFTTIPAGAFSGQGVGLQAAPYSLTGLAPGTYILQALMDLDGNFNPFDPVTAGATCGDIAGAHLTDLSTAQVAPIIVPESTLLDDVPIVLGTVVPIERPAFALVMPRSISRSGSLNPATPQRFTLRATAIHTALGADFPLDLAGPCAQVPDQPLCNPAELDPCDTALWVHVRDGNEDGLPDLRADLPADAGIPDIWPRVYLQKLDTEAGESWVAEAIPLLAEIGAWQLGGPQPVPFGAPVPHATLSVTWLPVAKHYHAEGIQIDPITGASYDLVDMMYNNDPTSIPGGRWGVTVVSESGQTWQLPNTLAAIGVSTQPDVFDPALQGSALTLE